MNTKKNRTKNPHLLKIKIIICILIHSKPDLRDQNKQKNTQQNHSLSLYLSLSYILISIHSFSDEERSQKMAKNYFPCFTIYFVYV